MGSAIFHEAFQLVTPLIVTAVPKDEIMDSFQKGLSIKKQTPHATLALLTFIGFANECCWLGKRPKWHY